MAIKLGIVGCGYGRQVLAPAFRQDARCKIVGIAAMNVAHARSVASEFGTAIAFPDWQSLVRDESIDAVAVATPPAIQPEIMLGALDNRKAVFAEKPMALNVAQAEQLVTRVAESPQANMIDFNFTEISSWQKARQLIEQRAIGDIQHAAVHWYVENYTNRMHLTNWKASRENGGGTLLNFASHCMYYLEWFLGPVIGLGCKLFRMPGDERSGDSTDAMCFCFRSGAAASVSISSAAYLGPGHRLEFYGRDGTLVLENTSTDYMKGFTLLMGRRPDTALKPVLFEDPEEILYDDGRILPASRLARRFLDWIEMGIPARPDFRDGLRVQKLLDAALRSDQTGQWMGIRDSSAEQR